MALVIVQVGELGVLLLRPGRNQLGADYFHADKQRGRRGLRNQPANCEHVRNILLRLLHLVQLPDYTGA